MIVLQGLFVLIIALIIFYLLGPKPRKPKFNFTLPRLPMNLHKLDEFIKNRERAILNLKKDNHARIIWYNGVKQKTEYVVVYLHGFSASFKEADPLHKEFAKKYGCNLYLSRMDGHGIKEENALINLTAERLVESSNFAIAVGNRIGRKIILMSSSTGSTLSILQAGVRKNISGLITFSPNIDLFNFGSFLLTKPWGIYILRIKYRGYFRSVNVEKKFEQYWTAKYRIEAIVQLKNLLQHSMRPLIFRKVDQPFFMGYYYKNNKIQDQVVSVPKMKLMFQLLRTKRKLKRQISFQNAGCHTIACRFRNKSYTKVKLETFKFAKEILKLIPVNELKKL